MTDQLEATIARIETIPLKRYCQITGEKPNAIYQRKFKGIWTEGVEILKPAGGDWWIDIDKAQAWVRGTGVDMDVRARLKAAVLKEASS